MYLSFSQGSASSGPAMESVRKSRVKSTTKAGTSKATTRAVEKMAPAVSEDHSPSSPEVCHRPLHSEILSYLHKWPDIKEVIVSIEIQLGPQIYWVFQLHAMKIQICFVSEKQCGDCKTEQNVIFVLWRVEWWRPQLGERLAKTVLNRTSF